MRLDQALVAAHLCESRNEAQELILAGYALVDDIVTTKQTKQVLPNSKLEVTKKRQYVSRGGQKLYGVLLDVYGSSSAVFEAIKGISALDAGASTGGFTDCLLQNGASSVTAVDVGTAQIHEKLQGDPRVTIFENTDIRNFLTDKKFQVIVGDLSFIPLEKIFDTVLSFGTSGTNFFLLIKPQFEVGKGNTKKGVVKDELLINGVLLKYTALAIERGLQDVEMFPCVIQGGNGNQEYFLYGTAPQVGSE